MRKQKQRARKFYTLLCSCPGYTQFIILAVAVVVAVLLLCVLRFFNYRLVIN